MSLRRSLSTRASGFQISSFSTSPRPTMKYGLHYAILVDCGGGTGSRCSSCVAQRFIEVPASNSRWKGLGRDSFMRDELQPVLHKVDLLVEELVQLANTGPQFIILHRLWKPHTLCRAGEEVAEISLLHRSRQVPLPFSLALRMLFDYLARHRQIAQSASQIAAGMVADPFCWRHGANAGLRANLIKKVGRSAVKQQVMRLRKGLSVAFERAGLALHPDRVLVSETTMTNEVRFRLRARLSWQHQPF
jgi:hypothetical protein